MNTRVIPTILTDTLRNFEMLVERLEPFADFIQIDYVDGYFAPELTCCEAKIVRELELTSQIELHLMVEDPINQVRDWKKAGASRIIGHIEEMEDQEEFVGLVSKLGMEVGLGLKLETPLSDLDHSMVRGLDVVLLMAHEIGVQSAPFNPDVLSKIAELRARYPNLTIEVDGGINKDTIEDAYKAGANHFAVGSDIFTADDPYVEYKALVDIVS